MDNNMEFLMKNIRSSIEFNEKTLKDMERSFDILKQIDDNLKKVNDFMKNIEENNFSNIESINEKSNNIKYSMKNIIDYSNDMKNIISDLTILQSDIMENNQLIEKEYKNFNEMIKESNIILTDLREKIYKIDRNISSVYDEDKLEKMTDKIKESIREIKIFNKKSNKVLSKIDYFEDSINEYSLNNENLKIYIKEEINNLMSEIRDEFTKIRKDI